MPIETTPRSEVHITIDGSGDIGEHLLAFEWKAFANGGYVARAKVGDPYFRLLNKLDPDAKKAAGDGSLPYFAKARQAPTTMKFKIRWRGLEWTEERTAFISDLNQYGTSLHAQWEFVAVDPPNYLLNAGKGEGKVYEGNITKVLKDVVSEYAPGITVQVTETDDDKNGLWPMMRQDPKTFIKSLLDWSTDLVPKKTQWITVSKDMELFIKEQDELRANKTHYGNYNVRHRLNDLRDFSLLTNNILSVYQTRVITQGISTVSGRFIDKKNSKQQVEIQDDNTQNKINPKIGSDKSFKRPFKEWSTSIISVPEHSAGDVGIKYQDYIGGRARQQYLTALPMVMRARISLDGDRKFEDPSKLGVSTLTLNWKDLDEEEYFMHGKWIVYGFHHKLTPTDWVVDVYIYRLDFNAKAQVA